LSTAWKTTAGTSISASRIAGRFRRVVCSRSGSPIAALPDHTQPTPENILRWISRPERIGEPFTNVTMNDPHAAHCIPDFQGGMESVRLGY
jgi:hypothetical protein